MFWPRLQGGDKEGIVMADYFVLVESVNAKYSSNFEGNVEKMN